MLTAGVDSKELAWRVMTASKAAVASSPWSIPHDLAIQLQPKSSKSSVVGAPTHAHTRNTRNWRSKWRCGRCNGCHQHAASIDGSEYDDQTTPTFIAYASTHSTAKRTAAAAAGGGDSKHPPSAIDSKTAKPSSRAAVVVVISPPSTAANKQPIPCQISHHLRFPLYALQQLRSFTAPVKTVYLIRHAQSIYNLAHAETFSDPLLLDTPLSLLGEWQASQLGQSPQLARLICGKRIECVVSSPLTRALQTALAAFPQPEPIQSIAPAGSGSGSGSGGRLESKSDSKSAAAAHHPSRSYSHSHRFVRPSAWHKPVRFAVSPHHTEFVDAGCDIGTSPHILASRFPSVAHELVSSIDDLWWPIDLDRCVPRRDPKTPELWQIITDGFTCEDNGLFCSALDCLLLPHTSPLYVVLCCRSNI